MSTLVFSRDWDGTMAFPMAPKFGDGIGCVLWRSRTNESFLVEETVTEEPGC